MQRRRRFRRNRPCVQELRRATAQDRAHEGGAKIEAHSADARRLTVFIVTVALIRGVLSLGTDLKRLPEVSGYGARPAAPKILPNEQFEICAQETFLATVG